MSPMVLDCSLAMAWCFEDEASADCDAVLDQVGRTGASVPALWHWEVANALAMAERRGRLSASDRMIRLKLLESLPIITDSEGVGRAWRETLLLAQTHGLSVYDAAYLELCLRLGAELATRDSALRRVSSSLGVSVLP